MTPPRRPPERNESPRSGPSGSRSAAQGSSARRAPAGDRRSTPRRDDTEATRRLAKPAPARATGSRSSSNAPARSSAASSARSSASAAAKRPSPPRSKTSAPSPAARWLPALAAVAVLGVVVFAGTLGGGRDRGDASGVDPTSTLAGEAATSTSGGFEVTGMTVPPSTVAPTSTTGVAVAKTALSRNLYSGVFGNDVKALQVRLTELGFAPGVADGAFGDQTQQAVWAYEKLVLKTPRSEATGKVTDAMWQGMQDPVVVAPRRPGSGTHVEIYLPEQVAAVFTDNRATLVIHISSGTAMTSDRTPENSWCETVTVDTDANGNKLDPPEQQAVCGVSYTPGGVFRFQRQVTGDRVGALGRMFNPIYFNYGIAMHGAKNIPLEPASHGCIRMHQRISDTFQSYVHLKDVVYVWGQDGKEPEAYTKNQRLPVFNYPDPDATTTTTSTTTTVKATTTTKAAATTTTTKPAATTTTVKATPPTTTVPVTTPPATTVPAPADSTGSG